MRPFFDDYPGGAPASPAAHAADDEPDATPEAAAPARTPSEEAQQDDPAYSGPTSSYGKTKQDEASDGETPAGGPEAPVTPTTTVDHGDGESAQHEQQLEADLDELTAKAEKADEYLELARRTRADFENYRKRAAREAAAAQERGVAKLVRELLPAVDNLDRAVEAADVTDAANNGDELVSGIKLVQAEVISALARAGVERFDPEGEPFDPECHEAVAQQQVEGAKPGTIVEVYQRGYRLGDSVIRPARVIVAG
jgi:molecular chaperone GrpE